MAVKSMAGDLAKLMAEDILRMELKKPGGFVTLSNIYAADGEWDGVENIRKVMKGKGVHKKPGFSWVEKRDGFVESETRNECKIAETGIGMPSKKLTLRPQNCFVKTTTRANSEIVISS